MASNYVPQVDFTSRDYSAIRDDIMALIPIFLPEWTNTDASDFGITLIELFAYMGDMLNYYIDRAANEGFISTATQRSSVLSIAELLGYSPSMGGPAIVELTLSNLGNEAVVVPALTEIATTTTVNGITTQIIFETDEEVTVPAATGAVPGLETVFATQGETVFEEPVGTSTGNAYQSFSLSRSPLISDSTYVVANGVPYTRVEYLLDSNANDPVYTVSTDADGLSTINFGDNISGRIPPVGPIVVTYRVGGGAYGNVGPGTLRYILSDTVVGTVKSDNLNAAFGGYDAESTDSIRYNAPYALTALNRAVSLKDYAALAIQVNDVSKAVADATSFNNITIYMAPTGDTNLGTPGVDINGDPSDRFNTVADTLLTFLTDKAPATTTITIVEPSYVPIDVSVTINLLPQYRQSVISSAADSVVRTILDFDSTVFAEEFVIQYILAALSTVDGISYSEVTLLRRSSSVFTGDIASGSPTITNVSNFTSLQIGQQIAVTGGTVTIPAGTTISAINSGAGTITLSANCAGSSTTTGAALSVIGVNSVICATNEIPKAGTITITASGGITQ